MTFIKMNVFCPPWEYRLPVMTSFDPPTAFLGGALIGLAAALAVLFNGRVAGISGILGGILDLDRPSMCWRLAFLIGLIGAGAAVLARPEATIEITASTPLLIAGGLLVGFGTRLGSGCTSGHGVCGLARGSKRSLASTVIYMGAAVATLFVVRHVIGA